MDNSLIPLTDVEKDALALISQAVSNNTLSLVRTTDRFTGDPRAVLCTTHNDEESGELTLTPLAIVLWDDIERLLNPPAEFSDPSPIIKLN